ncbi:MAG: hypothetical protein JW801_02745 [Bacteroidales bacterium]|nr:hypothetical protein [Bacteroidales bacterium]
MKFSTLVTAIILTTTIASGQKCNYLSNTVSGMDNSRLVITNPERFNGNDADVWAKLHQDSLIVLAVVIKEDYPVEIARNNQLILGENDEAIVTLSVLQDAMRDIDTHKPLTVYATINRASYALIGNRTVNQIRIQTENGWIEFEATGRKELKALNKVLYCISVYL